MTESSRLPSPEDYPRDRRAIPEYPLQWLEVVVIVVALFFFSCGSNGLERCIPRFVVTAIRYGILLYSTVYCLLKFDRVFFTILQNPFIILLNLLALFSVAWSSFPEETSDRCRDLLIMLNFSCYFSTRCTLRQQAHSLFYAMVLAFMLSSAYALGRPSIGRHGSGEFDGAWRGVFLHKNSLGAYMVLGAVTSVTILLTKQRGSRVIYGFAVLLFLASLQLSRSKSALVFGVASIVISVFFIRYRWQGEWTIIGLCVGSAALVTAGTIILGDWVAIVEGLGKDPTLTGRTLIWEVALERIQERFWLGFGRGAFYAPDSPYRIEVGYRFAVNLSYIPPYSHNGYIDLLLDVGVVGLGLFLASCAIALKEAVPRSYRAQDPGDVLGVSLLVLMLLNNGTESFLMTGSNLFWVMMTSLSLSLARESTIARGMLAAARSREATHGHQAIALERLGQRDRDRTTHHDP